MTQGQTDAQYMFLAQRLQALDTGWHELRRMWESRHCVLAQAFDFQTMLRDAKQAEGFLNSQVCDYIPYLSAFWERAPFQLNKLQIMTLNNNNFLSLCLQEYVLSHTEMPSSLQGAVEAIKKHEDFLTTMEANEEKINGVVESGRRLISDGNTYADKIQEKTDSIQER